MGDSDTGDGKGDGKPSKVIRKATKRSPSAVTKKAPVAKKMKGTAKGKTKSPAKGQSKTQSPAENVGTKKDTQDSVEPPSNGQVQKEGVTAPATKSASPTKQSLEEKRKALQAERLHKQREMEALLQQEEALLAAEQEDQMLADDAQIEESKLEEECAINELDQSVDLPNQSADSNYDTRSEVDESQDDELVKEDDAFESMDDAPPEEHDVSLSGHEEKTTGQSGDDSVLEESHEPPVEPGLAGLDDGEEDEFPDEIEKIGGLGKERAISPVTWDVDVHASNEDDNISVDSPIHSGDESDSDGGEIKEEVVDDKTKPESDKNENDVQTAKIPISSHIKSDKVSTNRSRENSPDRASPSGRTKTIDAAEAMRPRVHKYLYREAKYFMVKSNNHENVRLAKAKGVWSTPPQNEIRFNKAVEENTTVILVFSVKESGAFQGFARINGPSQKDGPRIAWVLPPGISAKALSGVFKLDWISRTDLNFTRTGQLRNPWNQHKPVKIARDGQEIEPHVGESLCKLFTLDGSSDYERVISRVKRKREALQAKGPIPSGSGGSRPPYRSVPPAHSRDGHSDYRGRGRGGYSYNRGGGGGGGGGRGGYSYRGGRGGGYRGGPPPLQLHSSSSRHQPPVGPSPHHHNYPPQPPNQYFTSGGRSSYNDYRNRSNYPPAHSSYQPAPPPYRQTPAVSTDIFVKGSYEQYLDQMRRAGTYVADMGSTMSMYDPYSASYHAGGRDAPPPPPIPSYSTARDRDRGRRPSADRYDRAVEDFLRRTTGNGGGRPSRGDLRSDHRYKESRDSREIRDTRDPRESRESRDPREYHRVRSRSREKDRHRERR